MNRISEELILLFDDMLPLVKMFKMKTYVEIFQEEFEKHKNVISLISEYCKDLPEEERVKALEEMSRIIPEHAHNLMEGKSKLQFERISVDFNMNMAVYVIPILTYTKNNDCMYMVEKMVAYWNESKVSDLTLEMSSYEEIWAGFKRSLCYITTAVCDSKQKPDNCYELTILRKYRDEYLAVSEEGKAIIQEYYDIAPGLVKIIDMQKHSSAIYNQIYNEYLTPCIQYIEAGKNEECRELYIQMVRNLQKQYLYS